MFIGSWPGADFTEALTSPKDFYTGIDFAKWESKLTNCTLISYDSCFYSQGLRVVIPKTVIVINVVQSSIFIKLVKIMKGLSISNQIEGIMLNKVSQYMYFLHQIEPATYVKGNVILKKV